MDPEHHELRERAKELRCLYAVNQAVSKRGEQPSTVFLHVLEAIPAGWQHPEQTGARLEYLGRSYVGPGYSSHGHRLSEPVRLGTTQVGRIEVSDDSPNANPEEPFLPEERELLRTIAGRLGEYLEWKHTQLLGEPSPDAVSHWRWRQEYAEVLASCLDPVRFGVSRMFLGGSTETGDAGPGSDVDLVVEFAGSEHQRELLKTWLEGWSLCLAEHAYRHTGYRISDGALDVSYVAPDSAPRDRGHLRELRLGTAGR